MSYRSLLNITLVVVVLLLAACAPEDLDITPTAVPSAIPMIKVYITGAVKDTGKTLDLPVGSRVEDAIKAAGGTTDKADLQRINLAQILNDGAQVNVPEIGEAVADSTPEATPAAAAVAPNQALLEHIMGSIPGNIDAGMISWRRDRNTTVDYVDRDGGVTARMAFTEAGGGNMELTFGVFDTPEKAKAIYDRTFESLNSLNKMETRDQFPTPNAFGGGTYGSDAILVRDNFYIRVSVPKFSSSAGDPLNPMVPIMFSILDEALASFKP